MKNIVYTVATKCYSMTAILPDAVMAWIGVQQQTDQRVDSSMGELEKISSGGMRRVSQTGQTMGGMAQANKPPDDKIEGNVSK